MYIPVYLYTHSVGLVVLSKPEVFSGKPQSLSFQLIKELPTKSSRDSIQKIPVVQGFGACGSSSRGFRSSSWGFHGHRLAGNPVVNAWWGMMYGTFSIIIASRILFRMQCIQHLSLSFLGWCHLDAPPPNFNLKCVSLKFAMKFMCILFVCVCCTIFMHHVTSFQIISPFGPKVRRDSTGEWKHVTLSQTTSAHCCSCAQSSLSGAEKKWMKLEGSLGNCGIKSRGDVCKGKQLI